MSARASRRRNPALAVFGLGNPRGRQNPAQSESGAWHRIAHMSLNGMLQLDQPGFTGQRYEPGTPGWYFSEINKLASKMDKQLKAGVHVNPRGGECTSKHVQAICYVHKQDGENYVHGFGDARLNAKELDKGILNLADLHDMTDVEMIANTDGTLTLRHAQGKPLTALFD